MIDPNRLPKFDFKKELFGFSELQRTNFFAGLVFGNTEIIRSFWKMSPKASKWILGGTAVLLYTVIGDPEKMTLFYGKTTLNIVTILFLISFFYGLRYVIFSSVTLSLIDSKTMSKVYQLHILDNPNDEEPVVSLSTAEMSNTELIEQTMKRVWSDWKATLSGTKSFFWQLLFFSVGFGILFVKFLFH